jgi:hypothetical protein
LPASSSYPFADLEAGDALDLCRNAVEILAALAAAGIQLSDASMPRFTRETHGALLLTDLAGATRVEVEAAASLHLELARAFARSESLTARRELAPIRAKGPQAHAPD